ncbi:MAG: tetratricopeptide repeat protein [Myxococcales bacterium]|nr:tetratricopeptide repeat protein [Myxococcales bacterium]
MRGWSTVLLLAALSRSVLADTPPPTADAKAQAKAHADAATQLFNVQQYEKASEEYQQAYLLDPVPAYLYASGQAQRLGGDCEKALLSYRAYLRTKPADESKVQANIERCEQDLKDHPKQAEPGNRPTLPAPAIMAPIVAPPPAPPPPRVMVKRPWTSDVVGHVLVGGGVAIAATGLVVYLGGRSTIADHNSAATYDQFVGGDVDRAKTKQTIGVSAMAVGGGLLVGGIVHYVFHGRPVEQSTLAAIPVAGGGTLVLTGAF